jgi:hypothetical protein
VHRVVWLSAGIALGVVATIVVQRGADVSRTGTTTTTTTTAPPPPTAPTPTASVEQPTLLCPRGWRYTGSADARCLLENVPMPSAKSLDAYCDYVADGYGGFSWRPDEDGYYQCQPPLIRRGNGAGLSFCLFDVATLASRFKLEPACERLRDGVLGVKLVAR